MSEQNPTAYRFATEVSSTAPKVGHHLATISYQLRDEQVILWVIEGPQNDTVGMIGMTTDFDRSRLLSFSFRGSVFERVNQVPPSPFDSGMRLLFRTIGDATDPVPVEEADVVFSGLRSQGRQDPDSAAIRFLLTEAMGRGRVYASITGYQRGWLFEPVVVAAALSIWVLDRDRPAPEGAEVRLEVELVREGFGGRLVLQGAATHHATIMPA